jgi:hypothetical protein
MDAFGMPLICTSDRATREPRRAITPRGHRETPRLDQPCTGITSLSIENSDPLPEREGRV